MQYNIKPLYNPKWNVYEQAINNTPDGWEYVFNQLDDEMKDVSQQLDNDVIANGPYYPYKHNIFRAFHLVRPENVRVVIIGQDPYPGSYLDQPYADGLAFSCNRDIPVEKIPGSLSNIFRELRDNYPNIRLEHGDLTTWALQGVLLLNTSLTVRPGQPNSHGKLWYGFVMSVINYLRDIGNELIYVLWGKEVQTLAPSIGNKAHILTAGHPSTRSYNFFKGNKHFLKINTHFINNNKPPIMWDLIK